MVSEDVIPGYEGAQYISDYGGALRTGEYKTIISVDSVNNRITVGGLLRYTYSNTVRIGKQGKHTLKIKGGKIGYLTC